MKSEYTLQVPIISSPANGKDKLTINQPLNQLLCTCIGPSLFLNRTKNAWGGIFFKNIIFRILQQIAHTMTQFNKSKVNAKQHSLKAIHYILINLIAAILFLFGEEKKGSLCSKQVQYLNSESCPTKGYPSSNIVKRKLLISHKKISMAQYVEQMV
jgi:hypothetical protein